MEYEAALKVESGAWNGETWRQDKIDGLPIAFGAFKGCNGRPLRIAVAQAGDMGMVAAVARLAPLVEKFKPQVIAMSGVCGGRPGKTRLGDVVAAERLFLHDAGKQLPDKVLQDIETYSLRKDWKIALEHFDFVERFRQESWWLDRPVPYEWQENWALTRLRDGVTEPWKDPGCAVACPQWKTVIARLWASGDVEKDTLEITAQGRKRIAGVLIQHAGQIPDVSPAGKEVPFGVHVALMGSGNKVIEDPTIWPFVSSFMRKTLGIEMEAAALGMLANLFAHRTPRIDALVMKGVMDLTNDDRDDQFKEYAARASAECVIAFLREQLTPRDPGPVVRDGASAAGGVTISASSPASAAQTSPAVPSPALVSIGKLPQSGELLVGREAELRRLDAAWEGPERKHLIAFVAWGGTGKTSLVNGWLAELAKEGYRGARRVLGWSFYSQGTSEERADSADEFFAWALEELGDPEPSKGTAEEKARRLAKLVKEERTLLVLDGVEPLQHPPGPEEGRLRDHALARFLRELCAANPGLCVVTSRLGLADLGQFAGRTAEQVNLSQLDPDAGAALLADLGVDGATGELRQASIEFGGHALALTLLGQYLVDACEGDVRRRHDVGPIEHEETRGGHARRVMAAYERWFPAGPERDILHVLGLFDRPARAEALRAVRAAPTIPGLTDHIAGIDERAWNQALARLRKARLIEPVNEDEKEKGKGTVDAHPLVREHFGEALRGARPDAWKEGHRRLYEHYRSSAKELPETLAEMAPLYAAVAHGCHAGRHQEALDEVYHRRICRGDEFYAVNKLGAFGADLAALAGFFETPWSRPVSSLTEGARARVLGLAGAFLQALGRLREAAEPMLAGLDALIAQEDWNNAAIAAGNLSELHLTLGEVARAIAYGDQSVDLADQSGDAFRCMVSRGKLADALHQAGRLEEAARRFAEAEAMQKERQPQYPLLYSLGGYEYCDLLLGRGATDDVLRRAEQTIGIAERNHWLLDIALDHLSLGRAHIARARAGDAASRDFARYHLDTAVTGLRQSGNQDDIPRGLLALADYFTHIGDYPSALTDLTEVLDIASRGPMRLHETDAHLALARLHLTQSDHPAARTHLDIARRLVAETGYLRRQPEIDALAAALPPP
ncbi:MAG TPA: hypothetical protein VH877_27920 [Polyangia bacterium]|nr:hypothetical protein [Polyangia bacterium]